MRRAPGITRWQREVCTVSGILPRAAVADWRLLREKGETAEFHAAALTMVLHRTDTDSQILNLM